jgi:hypothetical protein
MAIVTLDLRADAIAEARRLIAARRFHHDADEGVLTACESEGPFVARARRSSLRRQLGRRILLIWRVACEDAAGRTVESRLVALLIDLAAAPLPGQHRAWTRALLQDLEAPLLHHVETIVSRWAEAVAAVGGEFASARIARARAIAARPRGEPPHAFQGGLFDRREERARRALAIDSGELDRQACARVDAALETAPATTRSGELALVLTP